MTSRPSSSGGGASPLLDNSPWHGVTTSSRTSADDVHARIRAMIYGGQLRPGNRLPAERRLSEMFSVSRSTLREALSRLRAEGYVDVRRGVEGGTFVTGLTQPYARWLARMAADETLLRDIIEVRMAVECQIVWQAATRRTDRELEAMTEGIDLNAQDLTPLQFRTSDARFHSLLAQASRSPRLQRLMDEARGELFTPASDLLMGRETIRRSHREHHAILGAVRERDRELAVQLVREHLESTLGDVTRAIAAGSLSS